MMKKYIYGILVVVNVFHFNFIEATETYYPYPIIFVHGINSDVTTWDYAKGQLEKYFKDGSGYKYPLQDSKYDYFPYCDYQWQNKGDIPNIAITSLRGSIELALKSFPPEVPEDNRKVIIVAHSMGGIVTRSLLKQDLSGYYASKIDKVVFIGTPHLGSPLADSVWLLNKIRKEIVDPAVKDYPTFYSQNVGTRFVFADGSSSLQVNGLPVQAYGYLSVALEGAQRELNDALCWADAKGFSGSKAVEQLRLNQDVSFNRPIYWSCEDKIAKIELKGSTAGSQTFLGKATENLANPSNFKVIRGINPLPLQILEKTADWWVIRLYTLYNKYFTFPADMSIDDTVSTGDGIVPLISQEGIRTPADYSVSAFHVGETNAAMEASQGNKLLQSLDDPPVIESVRLWKPGTPSWEEAALYRPYIYVIVKLKDYLLADIEIVEMSAYGNSILSLIQDFYDPVTKTYKPYFKLKKDFLKERDYTDPYNKLKFHLMPGEFLVKINTNSTDDPKFDLKVKNPAKKQASCVAYLFSGYKNVLKTAEAGGETWPPVKEAAYYNFLNAPIKNRLYEWTIYDNNTYFAQGGSIIFGMGLPFYISTGGIYAYSAEFNSNGYYYYCAFEGMHYKHWLDFKLDIGNRKVKSVKFLGEGLKQLEGGATDFNILVYRDTSNVWPPRLDLSYDGNESLFTLNTSSFDAYINIKIDNNKGKIGEEIDPAKINPNGDNVWEFKPDFLEYDCIPSPQPPVPASSKPDYAPTSYYIRNAGINCPMLLVTFDEEDAQ
jgi:pimeloyl-ACP methyl ester carboxylesterase